MANKTKTLGVRIDPETQAQLDALSAKTEIDGVALARHAIKAALRYWQEHGEITLPLVCLPEKDFKEIVSISTKTAKSQAKKST